VFFATWHEEGWFSGEVGSERANGAGVAEATVAGRAAFGSETQLGPD
jgi:hypothetical protein